MRIMSFDVGIKNMAYCIINLDSNINGFSIIDWNILNLMEKESETITCNCILEPTGSKKKQLLAKQSAPKICGKKAKYEKNERTYCEKHALKCSHMMPSKDCSPASLKKMKLADIISMCAQQHVTIDTKTFTKQMIVDVLNVHFEKNMLNPIKESRKKTAGDTDLICIGRNMKILLDQISDIGEITHVIIENQISPIANRMKTIQGMLAQYFIMRGSPEIMIEFVSSANKLKGFTTNIAKKDTTPVSNLIIGEPTDAKEKESIKEKLIKEKYKQHKQDSIIICSQFLNKNEHLKGWINSMNSPKKDDLADCFLQGIWYLKHKNIISYAEDLKINSVLLS